MQSKTLLLIIIVAAVVVGVVVALTLLPATEESQASDRLQAATDAAAAQWLKAQTLLGTSLYRSPDGEWVPFTTRIDPGDAIKIRQELPQAPNPQALGVLEVAQKSLAEVFATSAAARPAVRAAALRMAGRLNGLLGLYYYRQGLTAQFRSAATDGAEPTPAGVADQLARLRQGVADVEGLCRSIQADEATAGVDLGGLEQRLSAHRDTQVSANGELTKLDERLAQLGASVASMTEKVEGLAAEASQLHAKAREAATAAEAQAFQDQALKIEAEAHDVSNQIRQEQRAIELAEQTRGDIQARVTATDDRIKSLEATLAQRRDEASTTGQKAQGTRQALATRLSKMGQAAQETTQALTILSQAEAKAVEHYSAALGKYLEAAELATDAEDVNAMAEEASVRMDLAQLHAGKLGLQGQITAIVDDVEKVCATLAPSVSVPQPLTGLRQVYLADRADTQESAKIELTKAIKLLEDATDRYPTEQRWVLQGQAAAAYLRLYSLTGSPDAQTKADRLRNAALKGRQKDPRVDPIRRLKPGAPGQPEVPAAPVESPDPVNEAAEAPDVAAPAEAPEATEGAVIDTENRITIGGD